MEIKRANVENYQLIEDFLKRVPSIQDIKKEIIEQSSILINEDNEIIGIIAFEQFGKIGLIRYFIFQKTINNDDIKTLFLDLINYASSLGIKEVISVVQKDELLALFTSFGLTKVNNETIYLNETPFKETEFSQAKVLRFIC